MTIPKPWSPTALDDFKNCPYKYHHKYVLKDIPKPPPTAEMTWGIRVHKDFEDRLAVGKPLPLDLRPHEPFMQQLQDMPGILTTEEKIAMNQNLEACGTWDPKVFFRGAIDVKIVDGHRAMIVDHKTGKPHNKPHQLALYGLWTFALFPQVTKVMCAYYWTKTLTATPLVYKRDQIDEMWGLFLPDLKQYKEAFAKDIWQKRPSGLCKGYCEITLCEHCGPKPKGR